MITPRALWVLTLLLIVVPVFAQIKTKEPSGPRAIAVLEWTPQGLRLIPVSLLIDGHYYDGTLYRADPVPMAVEQGTVYEVQKAGDIVGDFTVTTPAQLANGGWIGQGNYVSEADRRKSAEERQKAASTPVLKKSADPQEDRPVLRRGSSKSDTSTAPSTPSASAPVPPTPGSSPGPASGTSQAATVPPAATAEQRDTDNSPDRPVLKRGKPAEEQAATLGKDTLPHKVPPKPPTGINKIQVAVSDASRNDEHPYAWKWANHDEEVKFKDDAQRMALSLVEAYAKQNNLPFPAKLEITSFEVFDLAYNNEPQLVMTARVLPGAAAPVRRRAAKGTEPADATSAPGGFEYYVTLVATKDIYGQMQKMFSAVTDNKHLDAFPRFELIDAVDADGDKNGDLLFRRITDISSSFVLYKVIGTRVEELISVPEPRAASAGS